MPETPEEWRVSVELGSEEHGLTLGERLRSLDLDDEARERLGQGVIVTRDGARVFAYADAEAVAEEAQGVIASLLAADDLDGIATVERWDPAAEAWQATAGSSGRESATLAAEPAGLLGEHDWEVRADFPSAAEAREAEERLSTEGIALRRRWRHLLVGASSREHAEELAAAIRERAPDATEVRIEQGTGIPHPVSVWIGAHKPGIARDLGI